MTYDEFLVFLDDFEEIKSFAGKIKAANDNLTRIGSGSGRVVYDIDGTKVFKVAKNAKGVAQNEAEINIGYYSYNHSIVTKIFESADDYTWIIAEKGKKVNEKRIIQLTGIPNLSELYMYLRNFSDSNNGRRAIFGQDQSVVEQLNDNEFAQELQNFIANHNQSAGDMNRPSSYGEVLRDGQPIIVLTDYGLNDEVFDTYYSPQRRQNKYQLYELYGFNDGNDDILSDIGSGNEVRHGMWALIPQGVGDGDEPINEDFISFVLDRDKYPKKLPSAPYVLDRFHECVNNLKETLKNVTDKKRFYNNLLALQENLISQNLYNREPLTKEEYPINEENAPIPPVEEFSAGDSTYGQKLADLLSNKIGLPKPVFINSGSFGHAFRIGNELVLKITSSTAEAESAFKILQQGTPKHLVTIYDVYKIVDTENNKALFAIIQEYIPDRPKQLFDSYNNIIEKIMSDGSNNFDIMKMIRKQFDYDKIAEIAKKILTDNPEANINERDRILAYKYLIDILNIKQELINFNIRSNDYTNTDNLGYKNGVLRFFDIGNIARGTEPIFDQQDIIYLPENMSNITEDYDRHVADKIAQQVIGKLGYGEPRYIGSGNFGVAYDIGDDKILKITKDKTEAVENLKLMDKQLKYIAQPYGVYSIKSKSDDTIPETYVIVLEKLDTDPSIAQQYSRLDFAFNKILNITIPDAIEFYLGWWRDGVVDKRKIDAYLKKNSQDAEFFYGLIRIAEELQQYGVESIDFVNKENLGYKKSGALGFFDVGFGNALQNPVGAKEIMVAEDGSSKFSTDSDLGQDGFPTYNQNDTSPLTDNNVPPVDEDLEYNHVVGDATEDEYMMTERKLSYMPGAQSVNVKKKCRLGGLGNTSVACNQGDINNLELKKIGEGIDYNKLNRVIGKDEMLSIPDFPLKDLTVSKRGIFGAIQDIKQGKPSQTNEPVLVFYNIEKQKFLVEDGYHRVAQAYLNKETTIPVNIYSDMWSDYVANVSDNNKFVLAEMANVQKYYRAVEKNMGETVEFEPEGYYEAIDDDGNPIFKYDTFWKSDKPEVAASKTIGGAVMGLYSMFLQHNKNPEIFYIYEINEKPDVDISHWDIGDFRHLEEVRYRRSVQGKYFGEVNITNDLKKRLRAYYEVVSTDDYNEPDEEYAEVFQDTDYDELLGGVKSMVRETTTVDLPSGDIQGGWGSYKITDNGQAVGEIEIMNRNKEYLALDKIFIYKPFRGKGYANDAMKLLFDYADKQNKIITLTPDNVWGASVPKLKAWYSSLGFVMNKGKNKDFKTMQLMYRLPNSGNLNEEAYSGKAYRVDSGFWHERGTTAGDVVRHERDELENTDDFAHITDEKLAELDKYPAKSIVWVTKTFEDAKRYSNEPDFSDIEEFDLNGEVIGEDGDGGYLVFIKNTLNEEQLMSLDDLPFKKEVEERGGKIYSVGGAVRDGFLGKESKDLDLLIAGIPIEELKNILSKYGRASIEGQSFSVIIFTPDGSTKSIDIAVPRTEKPTGGGGHKDFKITSDHALPIEKDLERRDFTINAIAKDIDGNIIDPYNGQEDLKNKIIRAVNPEAFSDDPLRMLRAVQFSSRFGFTIEPKTMQMIIDNAEMIKKEPADRILTEFGKIVEKGEPRIGAQLLKDTGLYTQIFGTELKQSVIDRSPFEDVNTIGEFIFLLIRLFPDPAEYFLERFKTKEAKNSKTYKEIQALQIAYDSSEATTMIEARSVAHNMYVKHNESLQSKILPHVIEVAAQELLSGKYPKTVNELAINGNDIINLGIPEGKPVGDMQKKLLLKVYSDKLQNNKKELSTFVNDMEMLNENNKLQ